MDRAGFEPAASALQARHTPKQFKISEEQLVNFEEFLGINRRFAPRTVRETLIIVRRYLKKANYIVSYETLSNYLKQFLTNSPRTYNGQICTLRRFVKEYLGKPELIMSFKMVPVDEIGKVCVLLNKEQLRKGFQALKDARGKAIFLFTATIQQREQRIA